jgi:hypothetical protein
MKINIELDINKNAKLLPNLNLKQTLIHNVILYRQFKDKRAKKWLKKNVVGINE